MTTSGQQDVSSDRRLYIGFAVGLAFAVALNLASYLFFVTPSASDAAKFRIAQVHKMGIPRIFWVEDKPNRLRNPNYRSLPPQSEFYWGAFLIDVVAALAIGIACAQWYQKRGNLIITPPEKPSSTPSPQ